LTDFAIAPIAGAPQHAGHLNSQLEEDDMSNTITVGKRLIPKEEIAFVEPYDPNANPKFQTSREYQARLVMVNRESVLAEETPKAFAEANGFRMLQMDSVATNPAVHFRVESFAPAEGFTPGKAYATRLLWRDLDGNDQSKLLLSAPETVLAVAVRGGTDAYTPPQEPAQRPSRRKPALAAVGSQPEQ
jgi:hypothetical protein